MGLSVTETRHLRSIASVTYIICSSTVSSFFAKPLTLCFVWSYSEGHACSKSRNNRNNNNSNNSSSSSASAFGALFGRRLITAETLVISPSRQGQVHYRDSSGSDPQSGQILHTPSQFEQFDWASRFCHCFPPPMSCLDLPLPISGGAGVDRGGGESHLSPGSAHELSCVGQPTIAWFLLQVTKQLILTIRTGL